MRYLFISIHVILKTLPLHMQTRERERERKREKETSWMMACRVASFGTKAMVMQGAEDITEGMHLGIVGTEATGNERTGHHHEGPIRESKKK